MNSGQLTKAGKWPWTGFTSINMAVEHILPFTSVLINIIMGDIKMIESDWQSYLLRSFFYIPCNIASYIYIQTEGIDNGLHGFEKCETKH